MKAVITFMMLAVGTVLAQDAPQIEIQAEFVSFPKTDMDQLANATPNRMPELGDLSRLRQDGKGQVVFSPRVLTPPGQEANVKALQEIIYPADVNLTLVTNGIRNTAAVISPGSLETREAGGILTVCPELSADLRTVRMAISAEYVAQPVWKKYAVKYVDSNGAEKTVDMEQPFFHRLCLQTSLSVQNGETLIAGGGMLDMDAQRTTFLILTARVVDSQGKPLKSQPNQASQAIGAPGAPQPER
jgi:hypothetical protein